jgi:hypothetical protein
MTIRYNPMASYTFQTTTGHFSFLSLNVCKNSDIIKSEFHSEGIDGGGNKKRRKGSGKMRFEI